MYADAVKQEIEKYCEKHKIEIKHFTLTTENSPNYWFKVVKIYLESSIGIIQFELDGLKTGCGSIYMSRFIASNISKETKPIVDIIFKHCRKAGQGTIFTICGDNNKKESKDLANWGFEQLYEYPNRQHGGTHKQRIYQITI